MRSRDGSIAIFIVLIFFILIVTGVVLYVHYYYLLHIAVGNAIPPSTSTSAGASPDSTTTAAINPPTSTASNSDIAAVTAILANIRQAYLTGNGNLLLQYVSASTAGEMTSPTGKLQTLSSFTVNSVFPWGADIVGNVTTAPALGGVTTTDFAFIQQGDEWKLDFTATLSYAMSHPIPASEGNPNGNADIVITGATVSPAHPVVNDPNVDITITFENVGTETSASTTSFAAQLLGFTNETPVQGSLTESLPPGQTATWDFNPYHLNGFFKISDTPGQKTIEVSGLGGAPFTQTVEMYAN